MIIETMLIDKLVSQSERKGVLERDFAGVKEALKTSGDLLIKFSAEKTALQAESDAWRKSAEDLKKQNEEATRDNAELSDALRKIRASAVHYVAAVENKSTKAGREAEKNLLEADCRNALAVLSRTIPF